MLNFAKAPSRFNRLNVDKNTRVMRERLSDASVTSFLVHGKSSKIVKIV